MKTRHRTYHKRSRRLGLLAAGIASLLSPAGKIIASSVVAAMVIGGIATQLDHTPAPNTVLPVTHGNPPPSVAATSAPRPHASDEITHIDLDGSTLPIMLADAGDGIPGNQGADGPSHMPSDLFGVPSATHGSGTPGRVPGIAYPRPAGSEPAAKPTPGTPPGIAIPASPAPAKQPPATAGNPQPPAAQDGPAPPGQAGTPGTPPIPGIQPVPGNPTHPPAGQPPTLTGGIPPATGAKPLVISESLPPDTLDSTVPLQNDMPGMIAAVPEPSTLGLILLGLMGLVWAGRRTAAPVSGA